MEDTDMRINELPRINLADLPTPLQELTNLAKVLKGQRIFIKRDDLTGLAFGGNKTRKLEFLIADAIDKKADCLVTGAGFQSNWCTQAVAAGNKSGMKTILVKNGPEEDYEPDSYDGNHLLHFLQGAEIKVVRPENQQDAEAVAIEKLRSAGHRPYHLTAAGSTPLGIAGYVDAISELLRQSVELGINIDYLVHASGSGGTQAGLIIGAKAFNSDIKILGVSPGMPTKYPAADNVFNITEQSLDYLKIDAKITRDDIVIYDQYAGETYGAITAAKAEAIKLLAETEGIFLDPVYTAPAMACLIDLCRQKYFKPRDIVVFLHTGGAAALFPYKKPLENYIKGEAFSWTVPPWSPASR
jgi:L-cysteate sulfo-lyase